MNVSGTEALARRAALMRLGSGFGGLALSTLLQEDRPSARLAAAESAVQQSGTDHRPRARAVIQLFMHGGPSQVDLLDPKPLLDKLDGKTPPSEVADDENRTKNLMRGAFKFRKYGHSGLEFAEVMPYVAQHADDIAVIRSMFTEHRNHEQALWMAHTGLIVSGRPTLGSWVTYALGSPNRDLPGYVVLPDPSGLPVDGIRNWSSGWLPPAHQGTAFRSQGEPVLHLRPARSRTSGIERARLDLLRQINQRHKRDRDHQPELDARISSFELAARMQMSATTALDISGETAATQRLYGLDREATKSYGTRCLMARRLVERGVRFVQLFMKGQPWDTHTDNLGGTRRCCEQTDLPVGGLLADLKQRGLLDSTLVIWGGEFGRTPAAEQRNANSAFGRDHHPYGFSVWMAGGGIRGGQAYGATDDFGYRAVEKRTQTSNLHATILHLLGLDHETLVYPHHGRDERLTDLYPTQVIRDLLS